MNKVLIAVDDTKASKAVLATFYNSVQLPKEVILLHVQRIEGRSLMIDMLSEAEMSTLKESLKDTQHKEKMDSKAQKILNYYRKEIEDSGFLNVRTVTSDGRPSDEILRVAQKEGVELIILGCSGRTGLNRLIAGSVAKDVEKKAEVPVLVAKRVSACEEPYSWKDAYTAVTVTTVIMIGMFLLGIILQRGTVIH